MRRSIAWFLVAAVAALVVAVPLAAQAPAPAKPAGDAKPKQRQVSLESRDGSLEWDDATQVAIATDATLTDTDSDTVLVASRIEYNKGEQWARATGKPRMWDKSNEVTGDSMRADLDARRVDVEGNVRLVAKPKESKDTTRKPSEDVKTPVTIISDKMIYFYKAKRGTATGNLKITQKTSKVERTATGTRLSYDGNEEVVVLEGEVHVSDSKGQGFECPKVTISLKEGAEGFKMSGPIKATFFVNEDEAKEKKQQ